MDIPGQRKMPKTGDAVTINIREIQYIECCDCGLVHEVEYEIYEDGTILMTFTRVNDRTEKARIERAGGKGKLMCQQLDEATARENLHPENTNENPDAVKSEVATVGEILKNGEKWLTKKLQK